MVCCCGGNALNRKKLFSDYLFNVFRMVLNIGLPIIVLPFVIRMIGAESYGIFTYTNSIISYFCMFAVMGIPEYASRVVSRSKDSPDLSSIVSGIYLFQFFSVTVTLLLFLFGFYPFFVKQYFSTYLILSGMIFANYFNVEWFYTGQQRFKFMAVRSIVFKVLNVLAIFLLIREGSGAEIYAAITVLTAIGNGLVNMPRFLKQISLKKADPRGHGKPILVLFGLSITEMANASIDKTITGILAGPLYVGYYAIGFRLTRVLQQLFSSLNNVVFPRVMNYLAINDEKQSEKLISFNINYILMLSLPMVAGLHLYGRSITLIMFGEDILPAASALMVMGYTIPVIALKRVIRQQILLPRDKDKTILIPVVIGIVANVILNILLVPRYKHFGAAIATLSVETLGLVISLIMIYIFFRINLFRWSHLKYAASSLILLLPHYYYMKLDQESILLLFLAVFVSILLYFTALLLVRDNLFSVILRKGLSRYKNKARRD